MVNRFQMPQNWGNPRAQAGQYPRPMYRPMMNQQMNPSYPSMQMRRFRQMGPQGQMQTRGGGGLLAKLFGKTAPQMGGGMLGMGPSAASGMAGKAASGGSILQTLTNPTAISGFLNNTQQILSAIQQISPLVSQYGPIVKNLPAMWRLYRGLKDATSTSNEVEEDRTIEIEESSSLGEVEESSDSIDLESSNNASKKVMVTTSSSSRDSDRPRNTKSNDWSESEEIEESSGSDGLRERRSFPRMYI